MAAEKKLFPIFYPNRPTVPKVPVKVSKTRAPKTQDKNQTILDAGQKRFGLTQCSECNIFYEISNPEEEQMHWNHHNSIPILRFPGWKNEHVMTTIGKDRIIRIIPGDSKIWWNKASRLLEVVNRELGFCDIILNTSSHIFLYIKNKFIAGCIVAEPKSTAQKFFTSNGVDYCSEESFHVKCGVSRIWVSKNFRKNGIATALMDSLKRNFMFGHILENSEIALSPPTESGKEFALKYFKSPNFLIYTT